MITGSRNVRHASLICDMINVFSGTFGGGGLESKGRTRPSSATTGQEGADNSAPRRGAHTYLSKEVKELVDGRIRGSHAA